jgi:hypothetical protein
VCIELTDALNCRHSAIFLVLLSLGVVAWRQLALLALFGCALPSLMM